MGGISLLRPAAAQLSVFTDECSIESLEYVRLFTVSMDMPNGRTVAVK